MKKLFIVMSLAAFVVASLLPGTVGAAEKPLKIAYICKMLTHPWFISEESGLREEAGKLGIELISIDANLDDAAFIQAVDEVIAEGVDALAVVITDSGLGPMIAEMVKEAGIALVAIDDTFLDDEGTPVPFVGMDIPQAALEGGKALANLALERNFFAEGNVVKVMSVNQSFRDFMHIRTVWFHKGIKEVLPDFNDEDFIMEDSTTGMLEDNLPVAAAILETHPEVTHWIVTGVNDDGAIAPLRVFEEAGFPLENVVACGFNGTSMSYEEFQKPHNSYIVSKHFAVEIGRKAVQILYEHVVNGTPLAPENYPFKAAVLITKETYQNYEW